MVVIFPTKYTQKEADKETPYPFLPELSVPGEEDSELYLSEYFWWRGCSFLSALGTTPSQLSRTCRGMKVLLFLNAAETKLNTDP